MKHFCFIWVELDKDSCCVFIKLRNDWPTLIFKYLICGFIIQLLYYYHERVLKVMNIDWYTVFYLFQCFYFINFKTCFTYHTTLWALWVSQSNVYLPHNFVHIGTTSPRWRLRSPLTAFTGLKFIASVYLKNISLQRFCWTHIISLLVIQ